MGFMAQVAERWSYWALPFDTCIVWAGVKVDAAGEEGRGKSTSREGKKMTGEQSKAEREETGCWKEPP